MTGVEGRPEVILEGANSLDGPWIEYEFSYKPGDLERPPPFVGELAVFMVVHYLLYSYWCINLRGEELPS